MKLFIHGERLSKYGDDMKKTITLLLVLIFAVTACASGVEDSVSSDPSYPNASYPNTAYPNNSFPNEQNSFLPKPEDGNLTRGVAFIDFKEVLTLESFPLQFMLHLTGSLPTPCNQLRVAVSPPDADKKILIDVYSVSDPDKICIQVIEPFDASIPLGSFPEGKYTIWVNGEMVAEIQS